MRITGRVLAALCIVWSGFFSLAPPARALYGSGMQADRFPQSLSEADLRQIAETAIEAALAAAGETRRREVRFVRASPVDLPAGDVRTTAELSGGLRYTGATPVRVQIFINGKLYRSVSAYCQVRIYDTVLVAAHDLRTDDVLAAADVRSQEIQIESNAARYLKSVEEIAGRVPARTIKADTPLIESYFQQPVAVEAGAPVTILATHGQVTVKAMGVALQRGRIGQRIRVRNTQSGKVLFAQVVDEATVKTG